MKFAIVYGQFKTDKGFIGVSKKPEQPNVLELEPEEAEAMDPGCSLKKYAGHTLKPLALYEAERKGAAAAEAAKQAELDKAEKKDGGK